jgi:hypothetical protein
MQTALSKKRQRSSRAMYHATDEFLEFPRQRLSCGYTPKFLVEAITLSAKLGSV